MQFSVTEVSIWRIPSQKPEKASGLNFAESLCMRIAKGSHGERVLMTTIMMSLVTMTTKVLMWQSGRPVLRHRI